MQSVTVQGITLSGFAEQHGNYLHDLRAGDYESFMSELFEAAVQPRSVVVDGGAYIGHYTLVAARRAGEGGQVFSFEPHPRTFGCLRRNLLDNGLSNRVSEREECLSDRVGIRSFHLAAGTEAESSMFAPRQPAGSRDVACTTLDAALDDGCSVDVMKLDVEGGELEALRGMRQTLARSPAIRLFIEYNPRAQRRAGFQPGELLDELRETGLRIQGIDEPGRRLAPLDEVESLAADGRGPGHVNLYCLGPQAS